MARGWESKAVEDQISEAEADRDAQSKHHVSAQQREQQEDLEEAIAADERITGTGH